MDYKQLGRTGARVSALAFGTDNFGNPHGADEATSRRILAAVLDAGITHIDTADSYSQGRSEEIIGRFFKENRRRNEVFLTTKVRSRVGTGPNDVGASQLHILNGIDASLRRLQTDHADLYLIHSFDPTTPVEETVAALDLVVRQGKARYVGCSNWPAWRVVEALWMADVHHQSRFACLQSEFNIVRPGLGIEAIPTCAAEGVAVTAYSPLGSGFLTGKHPRQAPLDDSKFGRRDQERGGPLRRKYWDEKRFEVIERLQNLSEQSGEPMIRLGLQWVRETPGLTSPIIGARRLEQLESTLAAWNGAAPEDVMAEVRKVAEEFALSTAATYPPAATAP